MPWTNKFQSFINYGLRWYHLGLLNDFRKFDYRIFFVFVFDLQKSNIVSNTALCNYRDRRISYIGEYSFTALTYHRVEYGLRVSADTKCDNNQL